MEHASSRTAGDRRRCRPILVIEDDPDILESITFALADEGYEVHGAVNGKEGLRTLGHISKPCLILLDLMMPVMNGAEFLAHVRHDDVLAPIPVVIVSAWQREAEAIHGTQGFVRKPVDLGTLLSWVQRFC